MQTDLVFDTCNIWRPVLHSLFFNVITVHLFLFFKYFFLSFLALKIVATCGRRSFGTKLY